MWYARSGCFHRRVTRSEITTEELFLNAAQTQFFKRNWCS